MSKFEHLRENAVDLVIDRETDTFDSLNDKAYYDIDDDPTRFYTGNGKDYKVAAENEILADKILVEIENIKTIDEFNKYSIGWYFEDNGEVGDPVVSIYSLDEIKDEEEINDKFTLKNLYLKSNCYNDEDAHDIIQRALLLKFKELNNVKESLEEDPFDLDWN